VNDSENFGTRITEIGVAVAKIWRKEVIGTYLEFLEVARAISRFIFENQGVFLKIRGSRLHFTEGQGLIAKLVGIFRRGIIFQWEKHGGLDPPFMDHWGHRSMVDWAMVSRRGSSVLGLAVALGHGGSPAAVQWGDRCMGSPYRASLGRGRRCGDRVTAMKKRRWWCSMWAVFWRGEKRRRARRGAVEDGGTLPLYRG
jgi:hypothetical protein